MTRSVGRAGALGLVLMGLMTGCAQEAETVDKPSMEVALTHYLEFQADAIAELNEQCGSRTWDVHENAPEFTTTGCEGAGPDGETALVPTVSFDGSWDPSEYEAVQNLWREVAERHGFTAFEKVVDRADDFTLLAHDEWGGRAKLGTARNTVFSVQTGCLVWDEERAFPPAGANWPFSRGAFEPTSGE